MSSIEVLRGLQGTLFGRNASIGALSVRTAEPEDDFSGSISADAGNYGRVRATGILNLPVSDMITTRFSALWDRYDGYAKDAVTGKDVGRNDTLSFRGAVRAEPTSFITWTLRCDYQRQHGDGQAVHGVVSRTVTPTAAANFSNRLNGPIPNLADPFTRRLSYLTGATSTMFNMAPRAI